MKRIQVPAVLLAVFLGGCQRGPQLEPGVSRGDAVPAEVRVQVETAARELRARIREDRWEEIYAEASNLARTGQDAGTLVAPMARALETLGLPEPRATVDLVAVRFGPLFLHDDQVEVPVPGGEGIDLFNFPDHPMAASLVEEAEVGGERVVNGTQWLWEDGAWRMSGFSVRRSTYLGADWRAVEAAAAEDRLAKRNRNAALLYNLALDLAVPAPWIKPWTVEELTRKQRRISVSHLPADRLDPWPAPPDTFRVFSMDAVMMPERPGLLVKLEAVRDPGDTTFQRSYGERLVRYLAAEYPEYAVRFGTVTVQAVNRADRRTWSGVYPLPAP
jgi:hypothetical protein